MCDRGAQVSACASTDAGRQVISRHVVSLLKLTWAGAALMSPPRGTIFGVSADGVDAAHGGLIEVECLCRWSLMPTSTS